MLLCYLATAMSGIFSIMNVLYGPALTVHIQILG